MKLRVFIFLIITGIASFVFGQQPPKEYFIGVKKADSLYQLKDYKNSGLAFTAAFQSFGNKGFVNDRYNAARAWALTQNADSVFSQLYRITERAFFNDDTRLVNEEVFKELHSDKRWAPLLDLIKKNKAPDFGFERVRDLRGLPRPWFQWGTKDYNFSTDSTQHHSGKHALFIEPQATSKEGSFGCAAYAIHTHYTGAEIEVRAWMKFENVARYMGLIVRIDDKAAKKQLQFANMMQKKINGTKDWAQYSVKVPLPPEAGIIYIGALLSGPGRLWVDDVQVFVDGKNISDLNTETAGKEQLTFKNAGNLPTDLIFHASVSDGKNLFAINGQYTENNKGMVSSGVYKYYPTSSKWALLTDDLMPKLQAIAEYVPSTRKIYVMGGAGLLDDLSFYDKVETVDVNTGKVKELKVTNPHPAMYAGSAVWKNRIYIFGGSGLNGLPSNKLTEFDTETNTFTTLPDMPESKQAAGDIADGVLYTFGGYNTKTNTASDKIDAYDIATKTWRTVGRLPFAVSANAVAAYGSLIYVLGSYNNLQFAGYFDTKTQEFTELASDMIGRRHAGIGIINNQLYIFGGSNSQTRPFLYSTQVTKLLPLPENK